LIEQVWLKWYKNGGAFFSSIHANFLMNDWGTYKEVLGLIELAQEKVKQKFGINLINEVRIITN
jgi:UDP-N-acetylmuramate dehydrogenase